MDMSRVSACTIPFLEQPLEEALVAIAAAGFIKIDLLGRLPHFSLDPAECDPSAVKAAADGHGLHIANLGTYVGADFASEDPAVQEAELGRMHRAIDVAAFFGSHSIRVRPGNDCPECIERIVPWFQRSAAYAADHGISMGFENHGGGISGQPELCRRLAEQVGSCAFGVLYEPYNLMSSDVDYRSALDVMGDWVVHVHFKDGVSTAEGFRMTLPGEGELDFTWMLKRLTGLGYEGDIALEYDPHARPLGVLDPPEVGLRRWYRVFRGLG
jgi:sugar phosphate isomerase/epimerase